jgi:hypothetical protein
MAQRIVKSLQQTGRVSRARARSVAIALRRKLKESDLPGEVVVLRRTTASGRKKIAFTSVEPAGKAASARGRAARKRA